MTRLVSITVLVIVVLVACYGWKQRRRAAFHQEAHTRSDLVMICQSISRLSTETPEYFSGSVLTQMDAVKLYRFLSVTNNGFRALQMRPDWDLAGELLDRWGRPLRVRVTGTTTRYTPTSRGRGITFEIWSAGRNGQNENGAGDDIRAIVEILLQP